MPSRELSIYSEADAEYFGNFSKNVSNAFINNLDLDISFIDLPLSAHAVKNLVVRTGPLATESDKVSIKELLARLAPETKIEESEFAGTIRQKNS